MSQSKTDFGKQERDFTVFSARRIVDISVDNPDAAMFLSVAFAAKVIEIVEITKMRAAFRSTFR